MKRYTPIPAKRVIFKRNWKGESTTPVEQTEFDTRMPHADMLRYDLAFHNPNNISEVVFPIFRHPKEGHTSHSITVGRWDSFTMKVGEKHNTDEPVGEWITFRHHPKEHGVLVPVTLNQWMLEHPKHSIVGWR